LHRTQPRLRLEALAESKTCALRVPAIDLTDWQRRASLAENAAMLVSLPPRCVYEDYQDCLNYADNETIQRPKVVPAADRVD